jgi:hypothetical protein
MGGGRCADLHAIATQSWAMVKRHPWYAQLVTTRPPLGPHMMRRIEFVLQVLVRQGATVGKAMTYAALQDRHIFGSAQQEAEELAMRRRYGLHRSSSDRRSQPPTSWQPRTGATRHGALTSTAPALVVTVRGRAWPLRTTSRFPAPSRTSAASVSASGRRWMYEDMLAELRERQGAREGTNIPAPGQRVDGGKVRLAA